MFKIGDFSRLCQVSVKTLHHYDEVGLLRPARVDRDTGYRYYTAAQVARVRRILALKAIGCSLEQIAGVLDGPSALPALRDLLNVRRRELRDVAAHTTQQLARIDAWLSRMTEEEIMPRLDVVVKTIEPQLVASLREQGVTMERLGAMFAELDAHIKREGGRIVGPGTIVHHDSEYQEGCGDVETFFPIAAAIPATSTIRVFEAPGVAAMACLIYQGGHNADSDAAAGALATWIETHGYRMAGPDRLAFLHCDAAGDENQTIVEFQYPVEPIA